MLTQGGLDQLLPLDRIKLDGRCRSQRVQPGVLVVPPVVIADAVLSARTQNLCECHLLVGNRPSPSEQVHRHVELFGFGEVDGPGLGVDPHFHADPRPHPGKRNANLLVVDVAVVGAVERYLEPVGVGRLHHEVPGGRQVELQSLLKFRIVEGAKRRRRQHPRGPRLPTHDGRAQRFDVDRLVERSANADVLEGIGAFDRAVFQFVPPLVHSDEQDAVLDAVHDLQAGGGAKPVRVLGRGVEY